jgi:hypothetical protein
MGMTADTQHDLDERSTMRLQMELLRVVVTQRGAMRRLLMLLVAITICLEIPATLIIFGQLAGLLPKNMSLTVSAIGLGFPAAPVFWVSLLAKSGWRDRRQSLVVSGAQWLAHLAAFVAGSKRASVAAEWRAHLSGESGSGLSASGQSQAAAGFVLAALRYRLQDVADFAWRPIDAVLASRGLSNLVATVAALGVAVISIHSAGLYGLVGNLANVAIAWGAAYGLIRLGRWWRGVKPPEHKPRSSRELAHRARAGDHCRWVLADSDYSQLMMHNGSSSARYCRGT